MRIIEPSYKILRITPDPLGLIEKAGRTCYKSQAKGNPSAFVKSIVERGHESVIEHASMTVLFICDRGVSHELVRHRLASYSQESTRYANYTKDRFGNEVTFIKPCFWKENSQEYATWASSMRYAELTYIRLIDLGAKAQEARSVLPNSLKTEVIATMNFREWKHVFSLRCSKAAHPQIREIMIPLQNKMAEKYPEIFGENS